MDISAAQFEVLQWASTADSYDKIGFLKAYFDVVGLKEIHVIKNILANVRKREQNRNRSWVGPDDKSESSKRQLIIRQSEDRQYVAPPAPVLPIPRSHVPRLEKLPDAWWSGYECYVDVVGYDSEHVELLDKGLTGIEKFRGGKVAVVGSTLKTMYSSDVFHAPGTFSTQKEKVRKSGIGKFTLINGAPFEVVKTKLKGLLSGKLVVVVDGYKDFKTMDLTYNDFDRFDLQHFYKRNHTTQNDAYGMSLRDIYFLEFNEDFQGTSHHSAEEDARATIRIFLEGYVKRLCDKPMRGDRRYSEYFDASTKLKEKDNQKLFFCNSDKVFKDYKIAKCKCKSCIKLFKNE